MILHYRSRKIVTVMEDAAVGSLLETFLVASNPEAFRGIRCQLYELPATFETSEPAAFSITTGVPSQLTGVSRCDLRLARPLDFEARSTYVIQVSE